MWQSIGGGPIADIRFVDVHRVTHYLSKYFTKDLWSDFASKRKRVSTSRSIHLFEKTIEGWKRTTTPIDAFLTGNRSLAIAAIFDDAGLYSFQVRDGQQSMLFEKGFILPP